TSIYTETAPQLLLSTVDTRLYCDLQAHRSLQPLTSPTLPASLQTHPFFKMSANQMQTYTEQTTTEGRRGTVEVHYPGSAHQVLDNFPITNIHVRSPRYEILKMDDGLPPPTLADFGYSVDTANPPAIFTVCPAAAAAVHEILPVFYHHGPPSVARQSAPGYAQSQVFIQQQAAAAPPQQPQQKPGLISVSSQAQCTKQLGKLRQPQQVRRRPQSVVQQPAATGTPFQWAPVPQAHDVVDLTVPEPKQRQEFWNQKRVEKLAVKKPAHYNEVWRYFNSTLRLGDLRGRRNSDLEDAMFHWWESFKSASPGQRYYLVEQYMPKADSEESWYQYVKLMTTHWEDFPTTYSYTLKHEAIMQSRNPEDQANFNRIFQKDLEDARNMHKQRKQEAKEREERAREAQGLASIKGTKRKPAAYEQPATTPAPKRSKTAAAPLELESEFAEQITAVVAQEHPEAEQPQEHDSDADGEYESDDDSSAQPQAAEVQEPQPMEIDEEQPAFSSGLQIVDGSTGEEITEALLPPSSTVAVEEQKQSVCDDEFGAALLAGFEDMDASPPQDSAASAISEAELAVNDTEMMSVEHLDALFDNFEATIEPHPETQEQTPPPTPQVELTEEPQPVEPIAPAPAAVEQLPTPVSSPREEADEDIDSLFGDHEILFGDKPEDTFVYKAPAPVPVANKATNLEPQKYEFGAALRAHTAAKEKAETATFAAQQEVDESESEEEELPEVSEAPQAPQSQAIAESESDSESEPEISFSEHATLLKGADGRFDKEKQRAYRAKKAAREEKRRAKAGASQH
ncbi:hypothetical protein BDV96DRAFT_656732, partial [Lophiotrema nucula]